MSLVSRVTVPASSNSTPPDFQSSPTAVTAHVETVLHNLTGKQAHITQLTSEVTPLHRGYYRYWEATCDMPGEQYVCRVNDTTCQIYTLARTVPPSDVAESSEHRIAQEEAEQKLQTYLGAMGISIQDCLANPFPPLAKADQLRYKNPSMNFRYSLTKPGQPKRTIIVRLDPNTGALLYLWNDAESL